MKAAEAMPPARLSALTTQTSAFTSWPRVASQANSRLVAADSAAPSISTRITPQRRSEEHTSELQSQSNLVCRLLLEKKKPVTTPDLIFHNDPVVNGEAASAAELGHHAVQGPLRDAVLTVGTGRAAIVCHSRIIQMLH